MFGHCVQGGLVEELMLDLTPMMTEELRHLHAGRRTPQAGDRRSSVKEEFCRLQDTTDRKKKRKE